MKLLQCWATGENGCFAFQVKIATPVRQTHLNHYEAMLQEAEMVIET